MQVVNHLLLDDAGNDLGPATSPNRGAALAQPTLLVMHFTAGRSFDTSVKWLMDPAAKASAHLVVGRDGQVRQLVTFDVIAWHAGESSWLGRRGCNAFSIGIELDNAGELQRQGGEWRAWFGAAIPVTEVVEAEHKDGGGVTGWQCYASAQLEVALAAALAIIRAYPSITDVAGHEDIAPFRKRDPGPAFPMASFKARVLGRADVPPTRCRTISALNVRTGPGLGFPTVAGSPLPSGASVEVDSSSGPWRHVSAQLDGGSALSGWVHGGYLTS
jgi:N-acetylmuramoyl-L-alanine amidase